MHWLAANLINPHFLLGVAGIITDDQGRLLLFHHTYRRSHPWGMPGGWMSRGESPLETLEREFPDLKIEKDLRLEYHRIPVGWGNRVASPFLVYYLKEVDSPKVSYEDGIVTLDGKAKKGANVRLLTEMAIETFSGDTTRDLVNHLVKQRR